MKEWDFKVLKSCNGHYQFVVQEINSTPRKSLAGFTPDDVFFGVEMGREVLSLKKANEQLDRETWEHIHKLLQEKRALMRDQVFESKKPDRMAGAPAQFVKGDLFGFCEKRVEEKEKAPCLPKSWSFYGGRAEGVESHILES